MVQSGRREHSLSLFIYMREKSLSEPSENVILFQLGQFLLSLFNDFVPISSCVSKDDLTMVYFVSSM